MRKNKTQEEEHTLVITYDRYVPRGINSFGYERREEHRAIDRFWTAEDALRVFRESFLGKLDRIIETKII